MACDICGANDKTLVDLRDEYKTKDIKQICPECESVVNKHLWKVRKVTDNILGDLMRRFMLRLKGERK